MKIGVTLLLVACSLSLRGETTNRAVESSANAGLLSPPALSLQSERESAPVPDPDEIPAGRINSNTITNPPAVTLSPPGMSPWEVESTPVGKDAYSSFDEARIERVLRKSERLDGIRLGGSDYVFRSPILEGLVFRPPPEDASLGEKFLNLPVVRLLRPLPMASPPGGGKYFKWGSRDQAWAEFNQPVSSPGRADNGM